MSHLLVGQGVVGEGKSVVAFTEGTDRMFFGRSYSRLILSDLRVLVKAVKAKNTNYKCMRVCVHAYTCASEHFALSKEGGEKSSEADKTTSEVSEFTSEVVFALFAKGAPSQEHRCYSCIRCVLNLC